MNHEAVGSIDERLVPWLEAQGEAAEQALAQLITVTLVPVIQQVVSFKLRLGNAEAADADDLQQEALTEVLVELRKCRAAPTPCAIGDVRGLAATIAYRACYRWLRRRTPRRHALRGRLHYLLTRRPGLALWPDARKVLLSGLSEWRGRNEHATTAQLAALRDDEAVRVRATQTDQRQLEQLLLALFGATKLPVAFDALLATTADLLQIKDEPAAELEEESRYAGGVDVASQVEKRLFLQRLWEELQLLPRAQRAALLLNLRDADGRGCIALFPALGVASLRALAVALELPPDELAALWNQLPLEDARTAEWLGLTRQQVINARKAGRERLTRRLRGFL